MQFSQIISYGLIGYMSLFLFMVFNYSVAQKSRCSFSPSENKKSSNSYGFLRYETKKKLEILWEK